jgi:hypothetical protein
MRAKREQGVTWWNPAYQTLPVLDLSFFVPVLTLPHRNCLHSACNVLAVHISYHVIAVFVFRKPLFVNKLYRICVCYTNITLYIAFDIIRGRYWNVLPVDMGGTAVLKTRSQLLSPTSCPIYLCQCWPHIFWQRHSVNKFMCVWSRCRSRWPSGCWECGFESRRGYGCSSLVSVVCCQRSLRRAGHSSRGILLGVVCLSVTAKPRKGRNRVEEPQKVYDRGLPGHRLTNYTCKFDLTNSEQSSGVPGGSSTPPPPKFRSFDKAEPNSQFRRKYIHNNLIRKLVSFICKLSGTPD